MNRSDSGGGSNRRNHVPLCLLIYWSVVAALIFALTQWMASRASAAISDCIDATCRITTADGSRGTGCVFEIGRDRVFVLTAAHVVGSNRTVQCEFWRDGHRSQPLSGEVILRADNDRCDAAVVSLRASQFGGLLPRVVPVAPRDHVVRPGATLVSVGCAKGSWSTGWKGHALGYSGVDLHFTPTPADGRSGSAIFDAEGKMIVALLRARTLDGSQGIACSVQSLYTHLSSAFGTADAQCGPGGCPAPRPYLPPYGNREPFGQPPKTGPQQLVWPTLPRSSADLGPTNQRIDALTEKVTELLEEIRGQREGPGPGSVPWSPAVPGAETGPEPPSEADPGELKNKLRQMAETVIGDRETLPDRYQARIAGVKEELGEDAGRREIARAYAKDLAAEKLTAATGWTMGKILAAALGLGGPVAVAIAAAGFFLARRIDAKLEAGEPLIAQRLAGHLSDKIDDLKDRLRDDPPKPVTRRRKAKA